MRKAKEDAWRHRTQGTPNASTLHSVHEEGGESEAPTKDSCVESDHSTEHAGDAEPHTMQMSPLAEPQYTIPGMPDIPAAAPTSDYTPAPDPVPLPLGLPLTLAPPLAVAPDPPLVPLTLASVAPDPPLTEAAISWPRQPHVFG